MGKQLHDIWKVKNGAKILWKVQAQKGVLTFDRKKDAIKWVNTFKNKI